MTATCNYNLIFIIEQHSNAGIPSSQPPQQSFSMQMEMNLSAIQGCALPSPPPPSFVHIPQYSTNRVTITVSQNLAS